MAYQFPEWTKIVDNCETLGAVTFKKFTVPAGKRWLVFGGSAERDVSATLDIAIYNAGDKLIMANAQVGAGTTTISWGSFYTATANALMNAIPLDAGSYVKYTWGAAQTTPEVSCLVTEYPL